MAASGKRGRLKRQKQQKLPKPKKMRRWVSREFHMRREQLLTEQLQTTEKLKQYLTQQVFKLQAQLLQQQIQLQHYKQLQEQREKRRRLM